MAPSARTAETIRAEIREIRRAYIGTRESRAGILEEALESIRARAVAERIVALENELSKLDK